MPDLAGLLVLSGLLTGKEDSPIHRSHIKARRSPDKYPTIPTRHTGFYLLLICPKPPFDGSGNE